MTRPTTTTSQGATDLTRSAGGSHRWWVLAVIGLAQLMVVLDATIVNIALPSAQRRSWAPPGWSG